jgi:glycosyltransferase involved in cell wall biosynthesis
VRNGEYYIENFIRHYQALGETHIILLDNDSSDRTVEIASTFDHVTVLSSRLPYRTYAWVFKSYLINTYGRNRWTIVADIDEFLALPAPLHEFLEEVEREGAEVVSVHMLDMFPRGDFRTVAPDQMVDRCIYYEQNSMVKTSGGGWMGGVRRRLFGVDCHLTKSAILKVACITGFRTHIQLPKTSQWYGVFRHYKFTPALIATYRDALKRLQYYENSQEYEAYPQRLEELLHDLYSAEAVKWTGEFPDALD